MIDLRVALALVRDVFAVAGVLFTVYLFQHPLVPARCLHEPSSGAVPLHLCGFAPSWLIVLEGLVAATSIVLTAVMLRDLWRRFGTSVGVFEEGSA